MSPASRRVLLSVLTSSNLNPEQKVVDLDSFVGLKIYTS